METQYNNMAKSYDELYLKIQWLEDKLNKPTIAPIEDKSKIIKKWVWLFKK